MFGKTRIMKLKVMCVVSALAIAGLGLALGYDIDSALERLDLPPNQRQQPR